MTRKWAVHAVASSVRVHVIKHALSSLNLLLLRFELGLLSLGLFPVFISNLS